MNELFNGIYKKRRVLITGHTGFKGSWLSLWLKKLGAIPIGYALNPPTVPSHFELNQGIGESVIADIRDFSKLLETFKKYKPDIVFHMAAQPLVRTSYVQPRETFEINVMGTVNVFEAVRRVHSVKAIVNITSDKCYKNNEWFWGYREIDTIGGHDPYSASKACSELVTESYRNSYFLPEYYKKHHSVLISSARAGNVIGGGDWAVDRLIPDIIRSITNKNTLEIRNPKAIRPWQHVLEPLSGYLLLGQNLIEGNSEFASAWNFGPKDGSMFSVKDVIEHIKKHWPSLDFYLSNNDHLLHETQVLRLDCSKALKMLGWTSIWSEMTAFEQTAQWYKNYYDKQIILSENDIDKYVTDARQVKAIWT